MMHQGLALHQSVVDNIGQKHFIDLGPCFGEPEPDGQVKMPDTITLFNCPGPVTQVDFAHLVRIAYPLDGETGRYRVVTKHLSPTPKLNGTAR